MAMQTLSQIPVFYTKVPAKPTKKNVFYSFCCKWANKGVFHYFMLFTNILIKSRKHFQFSSIYHMQIGNKQIVLQFFSQKHGGSLY